MVLIQGLRMKRPEACPGPLHARIPRSGADAILRERAARPRQKPALRIPNSRIKAPTIDRTRPAGWTMAPSAGLLKRRAMNPPMN
jgi:hypothetical protein